MSVCVCVRVCMCGRDIEGGEEGGKREERRRMRKKDKDKEEKGRV